MIKIEYYEINDGLLIKQIHNLYSTKLTDFKINGKEPSKTHKPGAFVVKCTESEIVSFERLVRGKEINYRYEIKNSALISEKMPAVISKADVTIDYDSDLGWIGEYAGLESLYDSKCDVEPEHFESAQFDTECLGKLNLQNLDNPIDFSYRLERSNYNTNQNYLKTEELFSTYTKGIEVDEIVKTFTPDVVWHLHPCSISSELSYRIVRAHIKDNIDNKVASITSDYEFCFTVNKKYSTKPYVTESSVYKSTRARKPTTVKRTMESKDFKMFEMTNAKDKYKGYTILQGFEGSSLEDLKNVIDDYLNVLMQIINEPLQECSVCEGRGVVNVKKIDNPNSVVVT